MREMKNLDFISLRQDFIRFQFNFCFKSRCTRVPSGAPNFLLFL